MRPTPSAPGNDANPVTIGAMGPTRQQRTYGGKTIAVRRAERRAAFLEAGLSLISEKGFAKTSISDLCATANLARSQFYSEFSDRENLLISVYEHIQIQLRGAMIDALDALPPTAELHEVAEAVVRALLRALTSDPRRSRVCFVEVLGATERVDRYRTARLKVWVDFFEMMIRRNVGDDYTPPGGYTVVAAMMNGAIGEIGQLWTRSGPHPPIEELVTAITSMLGALVPPTARPVTAVDGIQLRVTEKL